jgi:hypothetical protein
MEPESPAQTEIIEEKPVRAGRSKAMMWTFVGVGTSLVLGAALFLFIGPLVKPTVSSQLGLTRDWRLRPGY